MRCPDNGGLRARYPSPLVWCEPNRLRQLLYRKLRNVSTGPDRRSENQFQETETGVILAQRAGLWSVHLSRMVGSS